MIIGINLDQIYYKTIKRIYVNGRNSSSRNLKYKEISPCLIKLVNPNNNTVNLEGVETNLKYAQKELEWYLSGSSSIDFDPLIKKIWERYSDDGINVNSAYGQYMFISDLKPSQWNWVKEKLLSDPMTRQAVININQPYHKRETKDFPCTMYLQFIRNEDKLDLICNMRSNDLYYGFRNDVYCFTELLKKMCTELELEIGNYYHFAGSMHIYEDQQEKLFKIVKENEVKNYDRNR